MGSSPFTFFLIKKVTKKVKAIRCGEVFNLKISYDESPGRKVIYSKSLRSKTPLRAIMLAESLNLKRWHDSQVMLSY